MNDQQRAAMQMALTTLEELKKNCTIWLESDDAAITTLREALAQPQGEWVDLTDDDLMEVLCEMAASNVVNDSVFAKAVIAKFKEKNTPPVVPQGEPVAWGMKASNGAFFTITPEEHDNNGEGLHNIPLYTRPVRTKDLTDDDLEKTYDEICRNASSSERLLFRYARAVIAADREKNK